MDVLIDRPTPVWQKISRFLQETLPKLVRSYGELIVVSEEVDVPGDILCLMQNALLLVRLSVGMPVQPGSDICVDQEYHHVLFKAFIHHITRVNCSGTQSFHVYTNNGTFKMVPTPENMYYRSWQSSPVFVTARRVAFEIRLRISAPWSEEDDQEADFFAGDRPAVERVKDGSDSKLEAIYGPVTRVGDLHQYIKRYTLWWTKHEVQPCFLVLRESALLLYKERAVSTHRRSKQDQCIYLRAIHNITSMADSESSIVIFTRTKSFGLLFDSGVEARTWVSQIREAVNRYQATPKGGRISALDRVNRLTTQIKIPKDPYAGGGFANVYKGTWEVAGKGLRPEAWNRRTVAVKVFLDRNSEGLAFERKLRREVAVWYRLDHPNIVKMLGITYDFGPSLSMVSPWLQNGTLNNYLRSAQAKRETLGSLLMDIVTGLGYLHSKKVIHGDLHPANILITDNGRAQLTDFGLSMIMPEFVGTSYMTSSPIRGAVRWAAPEVFLPRPEGDTSLSVSERSDVYSFGGIMYQVLCGHMPFATLHNDLRVVVAVQAGQRPERSPAILDIDWAFMQQCWDANPLNRPLIPDILVFLEGAFHIQMNADARGIWGLYMNQGPGEELV
ncbi:kinase-like domain-containing protein [Mycena rosella]|uniref:Kinase-like domain-containing protein n=1 Tax=Mycena rosella TaxID=1033263 RepID=A0AAD7GRB2_MYCRO|nr:kinase-like domain-containing protein [Mycena rosella]